ncbi:fungal-specific transcription factor domain-containing protein [Thelonectria olida]|uniref:Fungal-specific transcription factor domain-containing protein n=1 Tax=Thelonectria olida TaxID=1576542 RepID=A0A9P8VTX0_9HYPO|nr:fungal-specific transcription factor domain-containing protein [Thelonectria olida]
MNLDETNKISEPPLTNPSLIWNTIPSDNPATIGCSPAESDLPSGSTAIPSTLSLRSCVTCRRRKVKCDKAVPCANCVRHGVACVFPPPGRSRRKPRPRAAERILNRGLGGRAISDLTTAFVAKERPDTSQADDHFRLDATILGKEQWIERWWYLGERLPKRLYRFDTKPGTRALHFEEEAACEFTSRLAELYQLLRRADGYIPGDSSEEISTELNAPYFDPVEPFPQELPTSLNDHAFIVGCNSPDSSLSSQHPSPSQIPFFWQTFVENVNPLIKIFHIPTLGKLIRGIQRRIRSLSPAEEALIFAIYFAAISSMAPDEVRELLGRDKATLLTQYRHGTEAALARAEFMTSADLMTLQAFVLFICCLRQYAQPRLTWNLTALAVRIAQGIGVQHPDSELSPYDLETRRRLWLCLWLLDLKTAMDLGTDWLIADDHIGMGLPLNINDSDLDPANTEPPTARTGMTDMAHVLVKYEIGFLLKRLRFEQVNKCPENLNEEGMESLVTICKEQIEKNYLRHCADDDPLEWLTAANAKLFLATAPLLIYHPVLSSELRSSISADVRDRLLAACIETIECLHILETMSTSHRRGWLFGTYLHWHATALILETLLLRPQETDATQRSWNAMELALGLWAASPGTQRAVGPWPALIKLVEKTKTMRRANLAFDGRGYNVGDGILSISAKARAGMSVALPPHAGTASSNLSDFQTSISSMRHEQHSLPDDFLEIPNPDSRLVSVAQATSLQTSSIRPNCPALGERLMLGGSHSASEFTDNMLISEGSFSTNPVFAGVWPIENPPTQDLTWGASEALTDNSVDNTTEYWAVWNDLLGDLEK